MSGVCLLWQDGMSLLVPRCCHFVFVCLSLLSRARHSCLFAFLSYASTYVSSLVHTALDAMAAIAGMLEWLGSRDHDCASVAVLFAFAGYISTLKPSCSKY